MATKTAPKVVMQLTVEPAELSIALVPCVRIISARTTVPVLQHVLLEATDDGLVVTATNLELALRKNVSAVVSEAGAVTAPAKLLAEFVGALPSDESLEIVLEEQEGGNRTLILSCGDYETRLACGLAADFPPGQEVVPGTELTLPLADLLHAVSQVEIAVGADESRPTTTGILLEIGQGVIALVATDGHRLAWRQLMAPAPDGLVMRLTLPPRALTELARAFKGESLPEIKLVVAEQRNQVALHSDQTVLVSRLIDGEFPAYRQIMPAREESEVIVKVSATAFIKALKAVAPFTEDTAHAVRMRIEEDGIRLTGVKQNVGEGRARVPCEVVGNAVPMEIGFNALYVIEAAGVVGPEAELRFAGRLSPGVVAPAGEGAAPYQQVIMPIRWTGES